jgi:large subunit ribosomal protein L22
MGKSAHPRMLAENEAKAVARMLRVSPQKLNLVAQMIRGKKVAAALADLEFSPKRIARDVRKCLESAIANAENNHDLDVDELVVAEAHVGKAIVLKRFHARGRGKSSGILKPFAHLTIVVREVEAEEVEAKKKSSPKSSNKAPSKPVSPPAETASTASAVGAG